ncbi:hypothetical protein SALBM311S_09558 [Streptomyces alboniger]
MLPADMAGGVSATRAANLEASGDALKKFVTQVDAVLRDLGGSAGNPTRVGAQAVRHGITCGGAGLVRGPGRDGKQEEEGAAQGSARPDYLVEDEETHLPNKPRRDVPPVVN